METNIQSTESTNNQTQPKKKKIFKMPGALTIIIGVVIFMAMLSWIPHGGGKALDISLVDSATGEEFIFYQAGSLGAWQNWIIFNGLLNEGLITDPTMTFSSAAWISVADSNPEVLDGIISSYGLQGDWETGVGFVTSVSTTWPISSYSDGTHAMFGIFDTFKAMLGGYQDAAGVALYLIGIYAIVVLLMETDTLKNGVASLVKGLGGRELLLVPILFILFSLGGTLFGMQEETLGLLPIIVPVLILAGFDAMTGMFVAVIGTTTGIAASVLDPFSIGVMAEGLGTTIGAGLLERMILFIIYTALGSVFVTWYAARVRRNPEKSGEAETIEANKEWAGEVVGDIQELESMTGKQKASLIIFGSVFLIMILTLMPWTVWFSNLGDNAFWAWFSHIFYGNVLIGEWYFVELGILFILAAFIIGRIFNYNNTKIAGVFWTSTKDMFGVISIIAFSRAISAIMLTTGLTYGMIYGMGADSLTGDHAIAFSLVWLFIFTVMAVFIPSTSGLAGVTAPIAGGVISASGSGSEILKIGLLMVYPLAQGCVNMFSPTGTAVIQCNQSKVSYGKAMPWLIGFAATLLIVGAILCSLILGVENALGVYA